MPAPNDLGDTILDPLDSKKFGRIATQNAKNVICRKSVRENARSLQQYYTEGKGCDDQASCSAILAGM